MRYTIVIRLITLTFTIFPAAGEHCSASPGFKCSIQWLLPCMSHDNDCGLFYQPGNYKSIQQDVSGMRTFLGHRIMSDQKDRLVSLNKLSYCLFYQGFNNGKVNAETEFKQNKQFRLCVGPECPGNKELKNI